MQKNNAHCSPLKRTLHHHTVILAIICSPFCHTIAKPLQIELQRLLVFVVGNTLLIKI